MDRARTGIGLPLALALVLGATAAGTAVAATTAAGPAHSPAAGATTGSPLLPYRDGPPPAHTGGFGEPTCAECHFGGPVNADPGTLTVALPEAYEPGGTYRISVELEHPQMAVAGFQLAVRFADGAREGRQAGSLRSVGPRSAVTADTTTGVQYGHQTPAGAALLGAGVTRWTLEWTAPHLAGEIVVTVAANAANDDASEFGDDIYTTEAQVPAMPDASTSPGGAFTAPAGPGAAAPGAPAAPEAEPSVR